MPRKKPARPARKSPRAFAVGDLASALAKKAPFDLAEGWDNVGLIAGDATAEVRGVVVAVNLGPEALEAARKRKANVIVCHHPPIFKAVSRVTMQSSPWLFAALSRGCAVIALHTNFDLASAELNRALAEKLGLKYEGFLAPRAKEGAKESARDALPVSQRLAKFITYVPESDLDKVRQAVCSAGAGRIGSYSQCSFSWLGEGTFWGARGARPARGQAGRLERVKERRLEVVIPMKLKDKITEAARRAHPYEEMAYDVVELAQPAAEMGYGLIGRGSFTFRKLTEGVKETFQLRTITVAGPALENPDAKISKVAFSPGSGSAFVGAAVSKGVDVYVCGEVGYHQMLEARTRGLNLIQLGHGYSERFFVETVARWCREASKEAVAEVFERVHDVV
ncbi:MAG: Nif3-like dinuclear metal center hexameric protein [Deltaproteobacteria bacterium]|nr:Nif3-like dinuclear metal center hexameric protein [Deltaproteobacteria bacterium]